LFVISISRQTGSMGEELAQKLAGIFGLPLIDREYIQKNWLSKIATPNQLNILKNSPKAHLAHSSEDIPFYISIENRLKEVAAETGAIILGLGSQVIFKDSHHAFHIRVISSESARINRICEQYGIDENKAKMLMSLSDRKHRRYLLDIYSQNWDDHRLYHITINMGKTTIEQALNMIIGVFPDKAKKSSLSPEICVGSDKSKGRDFVHQSEVDFSNILDMYHIEWKYEPTTFPIEWDAEGNVIKAFTPDFFLPAYQTYIELTTMNQKYVTAKNKKLKKLKALYPEINITILYKKDINKLLKKFGVVKET